MHPDLRRLAIDTGDARLACDVAGEGPLVIALHGFPDCPRTFRSQVPALVGAGYRVALPALRGYAPSGPARSGRYHAAALAADVVALAERLGASEPVRLIGHDWGAIAAYAACALEPARFRQLVAMAVPHLRVAALRWLHPRQLARSWYIGRFQLPGATPALLERDLHLVERLWRDWSPGYRCPPDEMRRIKEAIAPHPEAVLAPYRELISPRGIARTTPLVLARTRVPGLYLHGRDDGCVGAELTHGLNEAFAAGLERHVLEGAGHFVHLEQPERVNERILRFFGGG